MSLSRTFEPFSRYSLSPERYRRRVTRTSAYSIGRLPSVLSRTSETSAIPSGWREAEPAKMTSSGLRARTALADCSPRTHNTPSAMLDLPLPFGPTTTTIPGKNSVDVRAAKDLKPTSSRRFRNKALLDVWLLSKTPAQSLRPRRDDYRHCGSQAVRSLRPRGLMSDPRGRERKLSDRSRGGRDGRDRQVAGGMVGIVRWWAG